jgi:hypothetical protein
MKINSRSVKQGLREKFAQEWYKTHSIVDGPNEENFRTWLIFQEMLGIQVYEN